MALQDKLDSMRAQSATRIPADAQEIMHRSVEDLRRSGILSKVPKVGDRAPDFALPDASGKPVSSRDLLARGPIVVSFFRGRW